MVYIVHYFPFLVSLELFFVSFLLFFNLGMFAILSVLFLYEAISEITSKKNMSVVERKYGLFGENGSISLWIFRLFWLFVSILGIYWILKMVISMDNLENLILTTKGFAYVTITGLILFAELLLVGFACSDIFEHINYLWRATVVDAKSSSLINIPAQKPVKYIVKYNEDKIPEIIEPYPKLTDKLPPKYEKLNEGKNIGDPGTYGVKVFPTAVGPKHKFVWQSDFFIWIHVLIFFVLALAPLWYIRADIVRHDAASPGGDITFFVLIFSTIALALAMWLLDIILLNKSINRILFVDFLNHFKRMGQERILELHEFVGGKPSDVFELTYFMGRGAPLLTIFKEQAKFDIFYLTPTTMNVYRNSIVNVKYYAFEESNSFVVIPYNNISMIDFDGRTLKIETNSGDSYIYKAGTAVASLAAKSLADRLNEKYRLAHTRISTMNYEEALDYLDKLVNYERRTMPKQPPDLNEFREFLAMIDNPHKSLKNPILIVGTKGKGSTAHHLAALLANFGFKVGLYTSPHLLQPLERIKIVSGGRGGPVFQEISVDEFASYISRIHRFMPRRGGMRTYFELLTAVAFLYFRENNVDYSIIEAGLGGKYDATNVIEQALTIITPIGYDHIHILGPRLEDIVQQKVDVIKMHGHNPLIKVVVADQLPDVVKCPLSKSGNKKEFEEVVPREIVFRGLMRKINSLLKQNNELIFKIGFLFNASEKPSEDKNSALAVAKRYCEEEVTAIPPKARRDRVSLYAANYSYEGLVLQNDDPFSPMAQFKFAFPCCGYDDRKLKSGLVGRYQAQNAAVALLAAHIMGLPQKLGRPAGGTDKVTPKAVHGRFEIVRKYDPMMIVDGAHNGMAVREFVGALTEYLGKAFPDGNYGIFLVFGANEDKDIEEMLRAIFLSDLKIENVYFTNAGISRAENPSRLMRAAEFILNNSELKEQKRIFFKKLSAIEGARRALDRAFDDATAFEIKNDRRKRAVMVVVGSFYLAGEAIEWNYEFSVELPGKQRQ